MHFQYPKVQTHPNDHVPCFQFQRYQRSSVVGHRHPGNAAPREYHQPKTKQRLFTCQRIVSCNQNNADYIHIHLRESPTQQLRLLYLINPPVASHLLLLFVVFESETCSFFLLIISQNCHFTTTPYIFQLGR